MSYHKLLDDFKNIGINKGDDLLIHMSYKSMGYIEGGFDTFFEALKGAVGDSGTLLFPTLSYRFVTVDNPVFDVKNTSSNVGAFSNYFMRKNGVLRSFNPTHSVAAYGIRQEEYVKNHYLDNEPVGENSPFAILPRLGGKVLMLGCGIKCNTSMHGVEEAVKVPYILSKSTRKYTLIDYDDTVTRKDYYYHDMILGHNRAQRYDRLYDLMEFKKGTVLNAEAYLIDAKTMWEIGSRKMKNDPYYFTDYIEGDK